MNPKYFSFKELTHTNTDLDNTPDWNAINNLITLGLFLDTIRTEYGLPIRVNCGYRSEAVNKAVGGVSTSAHMKGLAADIVAYNGLETNNRKLYAILKDHLDSIDQLISYHKTVGDSRTPIRFIHVGLSDKPRHQILFK